MTARKLLGIADRFNALFGETVLRWYGGTVLILTRHSKQRPIRTKKTNELRVKENKKSGKARG